MIRWGDIGTGRIAHRSDHEPRRKRKNMVANGTPSTDEGGDFISQTEAGTDNEPLQLANRHFELVILRQQKGTTAKSTDWGETTPFKQTSRRTRIQPQQHVSPPARRLRSASISKGRRRLTRTSSAIEIEGLLIRLFLFSGHHAVYCMLCCACFCFVFSSLKFPMLSCQVLKATRLIFWR